MVALSNYFGIAFDKNLEISSWGGLEWWGDKLSASALPPWGWPKAVPAPQASSRLLREPEKNILALFLVLLHEIIY